MCKNGRSETDAILNGVYTFSSYIYCPIFVKFAAKRAVHNIVAWVSLQSAQGRYTFLVGVSGILMTRVQ